MALQNRIISHKMIYFEPLHWVMCFIWAISYMYTTELEFGWRGLKNITNTKFSLQQVSRQVGNAGSRVPFTVPPLRRTYQPHVNMRLVVYSVNWRIFKILNIGHFYFPHRRKSVTASNEFVAFAKNFLTGFLRSVWSAKTANLTKLVKIVYSSATMLGSDYLFRSRNKLWYY